jgi:hypothetical protein
LLLTSNGPQKGIIIGDAFKVSPGGFDHYRDLFLMWPFFALLDSGNLKPICITVGLSLLRIEVCTLRCGGPRVGKGETHLVLGCVSVLSDSLDDCAHRLSRLESAVGPAPFRWDFLCGRPFRSASKLDAELPEGKRLS